MGQIEDSLVAHLTELLQPWADVNAKRMFGGWGLYRGALMFALLSDDVPYFKCGPALREAAEGRELRFFSYARVMPDGKEKQHQLAYAEVPTEALEDSALLCTWAEAAWQDALSARRGAPKGLPEAKSRGNPPRRTARRRT